jgi:tetratricopeptide (TPR) repeat protein
MRHYLLLAFLLSAGQLFGQTKKELAVSRGTEAVRLMEDGKIEESIKLLEEAARLDPDNIIYPYETAYAQYMGKNYQKAIDILIPLTKRKDTNEGVFQLLGVTYDDTDQKDKAIEAYEAGLKKSPESGRLYLELGGVYSKAKEYGKAISSYEKGIDVDPGFPSNYYRLAKLFLNSEEEVWGMIYGEIFINLERNSARTTEISKLLYDTYKSEITFTSDTSFAVSFSKDNTINMNSKKIELPFGVGVYEITLMIGMVLEKEINIHSLDRIRTAFVTNYFKGNDKKYPNVLFDYQNRILKEGHLEAYNHWILMAGDEDGFTLWEGANKEKWNKFVEWFKPNGLKIDGKNKFIRTQY